MIRPRILEVCAADFTAFHLLRPLLVACATAGWETAFACADGPFAERLRADGFDHWAIPVTRSPSPLRLLSATLALARRVRRRPPDLIHTHTPVGGLVGRGAALTWSGPVVHTFHGLPFEGTARGTVERSFLVAERALARRTTFFFSQARGDAEAAAALGIARPEDTLVIGNGVDLTVFQPDPERRAAIRAELDIPSTAIAIVVVARLVREKGLLDLAEAALSLVTIPGLYFIVVGEALPSDRTAIEDELDRHAVVGALRERWRRLGHRDDVASVLAAADLFVLPTYREGLPRSIIEAMALALPVIATTIPACRELVHDGDNGLLVPPRDARALADAIRRLALDGAARASMGRRGREIAEAHHDERTVLGRQLEVFERLVRPASARERP